VEKASNGFSSFVIIRFSFSPKEKRWRRRKRKKKGSKENYQMKTKSNKKEFFYEKGEPR